MSQTLVDLDQILSEDLKKRILKLDEKIKKFVKLINSELPKDQNLSEISLLIFRDETKYIYEDDGNTQTPGYEYEVYWIFPFANEPKEKINDFLCQIRFNNLEDRNCLYFYYEDKERIRDKSSNGRGRFLHLYLICDKYSSDGLNVEKIDYENDNYTLGFSINYQNVMNCIIKIKEYYKMRNLLNKLISTGIFEEDC